MRRDPTDRSELETRLRPPERSSPAAGLRAADSDRWIVRDGTSAIIVARAADCIAITIGEQLLKISALADVTTWCDRASLLLGARLNVAHDDAIELRTPPLVADTRCMALARRSSAADPTFWIATAVTPEALSGDILPSVVPVSRDEMNAFVAALRDAVSATTRNA